MGARCQVNIKRLHSTSATWLGRPLQTLSFAGRSIARLGSKMGHSKAESVTL